MNATRGNVAVIVSWSKMTRLFHCVQFLKTPISERNPCSCVMVCYFKCKCLKNNEVWSLPQAQICDLITSRETEKSQWAFSLWLVSPVFMLQTLQAPRWGAFSPKICSAASGGAWLGPSKSPEGHVASTAGRVTTKHLPRHCILLMQVGGIWASPVPAPLAPPAAAQASHELSLYEAFCFRQRNPIMTAPLHGIFNISEVWGVQDPHSSGGGGSAPTARSLLENNRLPLPPHWFQVSVLHECDGYRGAFNELGPSVRAGGGLEVTQPHGQFLQGVISDLLTTWQIQVLQRQTGSERWPAEKVEKENGHFKQPNLLWTYRINVVSDTITTVHQTQLHYNLAIMFNIYLSNAKSVTSVWVRSRWVILGQRLRIWRT